MNLEMEEGELWDDMQDSLMQVWKQNKDIVENPFSFDSWTDDFVALEFHSIILGEFHGALHGLYDAFGRDIVQLIMRNEMVGDVAGSFVDGDVDYYS